MSDAPERNSSSNDADEAVLPEFADPAEGTIDGTTDRNGSGSEDADGTESALADDDAASDDPPGYESSGSGLRARDVEVPMRIYKTVTVFSTAFAVICVVAGFVLLDRATGRAQLPLAEVDPVLAVLGIATILFGAATYAFSTRFRAVGMGRSKNDDDEPSDNG